MTKCVGTCVTGKKCKNSVIFGTKKCWTHSDKEMNECGVCFDERYTHSKNNIEINCGHVFCKKCIFTWIIEKGHSASCPKCRALISNYFHVEAYIWGQTTGVLYRPEVTIYPLNKLDSFDKMYISIFVDRFMNNAIDNETFILFEERIKEHPKFDVIFQKLKTLSFKVHYLVKKDIYRNNPTKIHMFT